MNGLIAGVFRHMDRGKIPEGLFSSTYFVEGTYFSSIYFNLSLVASFTVESSISFRLTAKLFNTSDSCQVFSRLQRFDL